MGPANLQRDSADGIELAQHLFSDVLPTALNGPGNAAQNSANVVEWALHCY